jgi:hypothetical protein
VVANKKRVLKSIYLQNFDRFKDVLEHRDDGIYSIKSKDDIVVEETNGVYVDQDGQIIGIYASVDGPVFILNDSEYLLKSNKLEFDVEEASMNEKKFTINKDNIKIFELKYPKNEFVDYDPWSSEDDVDFFHWLVKMSKKKSFMREYSL